MSEPIKLYRNGEMVETVSPSVAKAWQALGWKTTPEAMTAAAPPDEHWAADMLTYVEPEPTQRKPGRPKKTT